MAEYSEVLYWICIGLGSVVGVLVLIACIGCFFSRAHVVSRSLKTRQPRQLVWSVVNDFAAAPSWQPDLKTVEKLPDRNGHEVWRETDKRGYSMQLETLEALPPRRLIRAIADENGPFSGQWEFEIVPLDDGSQLTLTEKGQIPNPFFRFMFRLFMTPTWYIDLYLKALAGKLQQLEEPVGEKRSRP